MPVTGPVGELDAIVGENGVDLVRQGLDQVAQEPGSSHLARLFHQAHKGELRCAVNGHEHVKLAFSRAQLGDVDVNVADGVVPELLPGLVAFDLRQPGNAVALEQPVQGGSAQMRDRFLQSIEAIVQCKERVLAKS